MTHPLDLQLAAGLRGDFDEGWRIAKGLPQDDPRAMFNRGWYLLRQGKLQEGYRLLDAGRALNVFGNQHIGSTRPIWRGDAVGTVLLNLEGGLGDQIHGVRWARDVVRCGNRVVVACSPELAPLFVSVEGVSAVVQHEAALGVYHDAWLPSMSAVVALGYEYEDLDGSAYIPRPCGSRGYTGVRWSGNPVFEHEQHRAFPPGLMFDAVQGRGRCVSLQRDDGAALRPTWMGEAPLGDWVETARSVSMCDLVVTSCTSVAHLAAAMGVRTWIVVPVLSYYLWALPGDTTAYYDSVRLFRQEIYGDWTEPFEAIGACVQDLAA